MINYDILIAIGVILTLLTFVKYIAPILRKKKLEYYKEVKLGLIIMGYAFRDDKLEKIANEALEIVKDLEGLSIQPVEKHDEAVYQLSRRLLDKYEVSINDEALDLIIDIAVTLLPKSN